MNSLVKVRVTGALACFSRPEMKVERASYEVMTPSAARGVLDAILWKPEMRWIVRRIKVLNPIQFTGFRRNEVQSKLALSSVRKWMQVPSGYTPQSAGAGSDDATPRNTLALKDVAYVIEAEPLVYRPNQDDTPAKFASMFSRRVEKGQCAHRPYLGCREFAAQFAPPRPDEQPIDDSRDLGMMLYDIVFRDQGRANYPVFFPARLEKGVLQTSPEHALADENLRKEVLACSYKRS